jgi:hypothetical protein
MERGHDALPLGVLALVFEHLDIASRLRARRVCRGWRGSAAVGCAHLRVEVSQPASSVHRLKVGRVRLCGRRSRLNLEDSDIADVETTFDKARWMNRTRGHLPQPIVLDAEADLALTAPPRLQQTRGGVALLIDRSTVSLRCQLEAGDAAGEEEGPGLGPVQAAEDSGQSDTISPVRSPQQPEYEREAAAQARQVTVLEALDLSKSTFHPCVRVQCGIDSYRDLKPRTLQRGLRQVDLAGLCWLQSLSVRGCGGLRLLLVPPCLTALDASGAAQLRTLGCGHSHDSCLGHAVAGGRIQILNLNGCRELLHAGLLSAAVPAAAQHPQPSSSSPPPPSSRAALARCRELDLSYCQRLPVATVATALASAGVLASLSLRHVAQDPMLRSLAASPAAAHTLRLVDCAFSAGMSDAAVEALVQAAPRLQRVNLRGCAAISAACYNQTPITLTRRGAAHGAAAAAAAAAATDDGTDPLRAAPPREGGGGSCMQGKRRKGDNVFFFTSRR